MKYSSSKILTVNSQKHEGLDVSLGWLNKNLWTVKCQLCIPAPGLGQSRIGGICCRGGKEEIVDEYNPRSVNLGRIEDYFA